MQVRRGTPNLARHAMPRKQLGLGFSQEVWQAMSRQTQIDALQQHFGRKFLAGHDWEIGLHCNGAWEFSHSELVVFFGDALFND